MATQELISGRLYATKVLQTLSTDLMPILRGLGLLVSVKRDQHRSMADFLQKHADTRPDAIALVDKQHSVTWREFNQRANQVAHYFQGRGFVKGDTVAVMMENRVEVLLVVAGLAKLGVVASMINTSQRGDVLAHSLTVAPVKAIVVGSELVDAVAAVAGRLDLNAEEDIYEVADTAPSIEHHQWTYRDLFSLVSDLSVENLAVTQTVQLKDTLYLVFTSGTTGLPKASRMTHHRFFRAIAGIGLASFRLKPSDVLYTPLPLYHNNALTLAFGAILGNGATLAIARKFSASHFWEDIARFKATSFVYIGELCRYLMAQPVKPEERQHNVRVILGNGLRPDIWMEFKERFSIPRINEFYGSSEGNLMFTNVFNIDKTAGTCPLPYVVARYDVENEALVRDAKGHCEKVKKGEVGLLLMPISDRTPFDGYTDKNASNSKILEDLFKPGDRYINTGDLVLQQGFGHIAFVDRLGDTFRWKGENVATGEVEAALLKHPAVEHAAVYGVSLPHSDGRAGMAAITLVEDADDSTVDELGAYLKEALPHYAVPVFIRIQPHQAVTSTFKYSKIKLKQQSYAEASPDAVYVLTAGQDVYRPLEEGTLQQIEKGEVRL